MEVPCRRDLNDVEADDFALGGDTSQEIGSLVIAKPAPRIVTAKAIAATNETAAVECFRK